MKRFWGVAALAGAVLGLALLGNPSAVERPFRLAQAQERCHPSYEGRCVPYASDVDCAGGGGNGPEYVRGPVRVVGPDVYDLDRDGDGIACEN